MEVDGRAFIGKMLRNRIESCRLHVKASQWLLLWCSISLNTLINFYSSIVFGQDWASYNSDPTIFSQMAQNEIIIFLFKSSQHNIIIRLTSTICDDHAYISADVGNLIISPSSLPINLYSVLANILVLSDTFA